MESDDYRAVLKSQPELENISISAVQRCICRCIVKPSVQQGICPHCTSMRHMLQAWAKARRKLEEASESGRACSCYECGPDGKWRWASSSSDALLDAITCGRCVCNGLAVEGGEPPKLRRLECCLQPRNMTLARKKELKLPTDSNKTDHYPFYINRQALSLAVRALALCLRVFFSFLAPLARQVPTLWVGQ